MKYFKYNFTKKHTFEKEETFQETNHSYHCSHNYICSENTDTPVWSSCLSVGTVLNLPGNVLLRWSKFSPSSCLLLARSKLWLLVTYTLFAHFADTSSSEMACISLSCSWGLSSDIDAPGDDDFNCSSSSNDNCFCCSCKSYRRQKKGFNFTTCQNVFLAFWLLHVFLIIRWYMKWPCMEETDSTWVLKHFSQIQQNASWNFKNLSIQY